MSEVVEGAFLLFLKEFQKATPRNAETEQLHALIDNLLSQLRCHHAYYDERWGLHLTCDDERTWRNPRPDEIQTCPGCNGTGVLTSIALNIKRECSHCKGRGYVLKKSDVVENSEVTRQ